MNYTLKHADCMDIMPTMANNSVDFTLTDIPYDMVNRNDNGLRNLNKGKAGILTFDLNKFLNEIYRVTKNTIVVFCDVNQVSEIFNFFANKQASKKGTTRQLIWSKTNPSPMNGDYIYLSSIENAIWFKKRGGVFNPHCKGCVFTHPCGRSKLHPTEKNHELLKELILDNTNEGDWVFDPCMGSGSHGKVALENGRKFAGIELDDKYFEIAKENIKGVK